MATVTLNARGLAAIIGTVLGRTISPKQVRGRVRGDSGEPVLKAYGADKAPYASHVYSIADANRILAAFVKSHNARTNANIETPTILADGTLSKSRTRTARKARATARKVNGNGQSATVTATPATDNDSN